MQMSNGIRQGSCLSPYLFSVYADELNARLMQSNVGCHVADRCINSLSYADDMVIAAPNARALNILLGICKKFASEHFITYSIEKTEAMLIKPSGIPSFVPPEIYIGDDVIGYVQNFRYLGHIISSDLSDDMDIERETRSLYIRGNTIIRKFHFVSSEIKCNLFKAYCYPLYTCSLWSKYRQSTINKIRVAYNNIMRKFMGLPPWHSARTLFVNLNVRSFYETIRTTSYSLMQRVLGCQNAVVQTMIHSISFAHSETRKQWCYDLAYENQLGWFGFVHS